MTAEGEAFKKKKDAEEPAYLIYRTTEILLLVFMHKASKRKKSQTASDTFPSVKMPVSGYQSRYSHRKRHSHKRRLKCENKEATARKKYLYHSEEAASISRALQA